MSASAACSLGAAPVLVLEALQWARPDASYRVRPDGCRENSSGAGPTRVPGVTSGIRPLVAARCLSNRFETNCSIDIERKGGLGPEYWQDFVGLVNVTRKQAD